MVAPVGTAVGESLMGAAVGTAVGESLMGAHVGTAVGASPLGLHVGSKTGAWVGDEVGCSVWGSGEQSLGASVEYDSLGVSVKYASPPLGASV